MAPQESLDRCRKLAPSTQRDKTHPARYSSPQELGLAYSSRHCLQSKMISQVIADNVSAKQEKLNEETELASRDSNTSGAQWMPLNESALLNVVTPLGFDCAQTSTKALPCIGNKQAQQWCHVKMRIYQTAVGRMSPSSSIPGASSGLASFSGFPLP